MSPDIGDMDIDSDYWSIIIDSVQRSVDSDFIYHFDNIIDINNREGRVFMLLVIIAST